VPYGKRVFHAVVGNPPWDRMLPADKEFFAAYEFPILDAPTKREREAIQNRLLSDPAVQAKHARYVGEFRDFENILGIFYKYQVVQVNGEKTIGKQDSFRVFMERNAQLMTQGAYAGVVVPSAFHANEGATGIRRLYMEEMKLTHCYSFENRRKLFEIDSRFKFAAVVVRAGAITDTFSCAFYLHDDEWLFGDRRSREILNYKLEFVRKTGGEYLSLLELRSAKDLEVAAICFDNGEPLGNVCDRLGIRLGRELNMTDDAWRFTPTQDVLPDGEDPRDPDVARRLLEMGYLVLHEGKTFHQYQDRWGDSPRYLVKIGDLISNPQVLEAVKFFRIGIREVSGATNERTLISSILSSGSTSGHTVTHERQPHTRKNYSSLLIIGILNSHLLDWCARLSVSSHVTKYILNSLPVVLCNHSFIAHSSLRLICSHIGYLHLFNDQIGTYHPSEEPRTVLDHTLTSDDARWEVRSAIDAVVAHAYGLTRDQYAHVLSTFSHASYKRAPELCLAKFDELNQTGLDAFTKKYDPYWDIPLNENLPQPDPAVAAAIDTFIAQAEREHQAERQLPMFPGEPPARGRKKNGSSNSM
ncbi:MAG TPA: hypothetical protein PKJ56_08030, partial [Promineifilum sp.]|nr:hypothetical protein [Promineifilum sp.]